MNNPIYRAADGMESGASTASRVAAPRANPALTHASAAPRVYVCSERSPRHPTRYR